MICNLAENAWVYFKIISWLYGTNPNDTSNKSMVHLGWLGLVPQNRLGLEYFLANDDSISMPYHKHAVR